MQAEAADRLRPRQKSRRKIKGGELVWKLFRAILIIGISFMIVYPFYIKIVSTFMSTDDLLMSTVKYIPRNLSTVTLESVWKLMRFPKALLNTTLLSFAVAMIQTFVGALVGYSFARFKFRGKNLLMVLVLITFVVPPQTIFIPLYITFQSFGIGSVTVNLLNTPWPFMILSLTGLGLKNGFYIYLMQQFYRGLPKEFEESAFIDGAGPFRTFFSVIMPNASNMMLTVFLFSFTWQWTDTNYSNMFLQKFDLLSRNINWTMPANITDPVIWSTMKNTGCLLIIIPLLIIFLFAQKYFVQGIERSGIVG